MQPAKPIIEEDIEAKLRRIPKYRVILHNDDYHTFDQVIRWIVITVQLPIADAVRITYKIHNEGAATVVIVVKELAEHYMDIFRGYGMGCTIEPE
jgi:ATP-dependent Clp protease adaptor protein ClpS